jgi:hypothetical protein
MMPMKGWLIMMGWMVLCSTSSVFAKNSEYSSEETRHPDGNKKSKCWAILHKALVGKDDGDENSVDLSPLHRLQVDDDLATGKGLYAKWHRNALRLLCDYLFDIPAEEYFTEDLYRDEKYLREEKFWGKKDSQNEESNEKHSDSSKQEEESSDGEYWKWGEVFPTAKQLKKRFTSEDLLQMNIDLRRLLEIEYLRTLPTSRSYTPEEESLLDEAIAALDRSSGRRRLFILRNDANAMDNVE